MINNDIPGGILHELPSDLEKALISNPNVIKTWRDLTPLARNEWICWTISVKQSVTRNKHIERTVREVQEGKRRPCCWTGCIQRSDKAISPSVQGLLNKQLKEHIII